LPHIEPLSEQQVVNALNLRQSCQQAEDALSQGMEKLQQTLAETVAAGQLGETSYSPHKETAMEKKLEDLVRFVLQVFFCIFSCTHIHIRNP
jgi:transcription factor TGA